MEEESFNIYAPVARISTIRLLLSKTIIENLKIVQLNIPTAFLNRKLDINVYIKSSEEVKTIPNVLKLNRAYEVQEAPRC